MPKYPGGAIQLGETDWDVIGDPAPTTGHLWEIRDHTDTVIALSDSGDPGLPVDGWLVSLHYFSGVGYFTIYIGSGATVGETYTAYAALTTARHYGFTVEALPAATCGPIDLAIILDTTGSMQSAVQVIREHITPIVDRVVEVSGNDYRLALVTTPNDDVMIFELFATNNRATVEPILPLLPDGGGGTFPESTDEALDTVINCLPARTKQYDRNEVELDFSPCWRDGVLRLVVLITDAEPGGFSSVYDSTAMAHVTAVIADAVTAGVKIATVYVPTPSSTPSLVLPIMERYASETGGSFIETDSVGDGVSSALTSILDACGAPLPSSSSSSSLEVVPCEPTVGRTITDALELYWGSPESDRVYLWKVWPRAFTPLGFTSYDEDITYNDGTGDLIYRSAGSSLASDIPVSIGLSTDSTDVITLLHMFGVTEGDVYAGKFSNTSLKVMAVNPDDLTIRDLTLTGGKLGNFTLVNTSIKFAMDSWAVLLNKNVGRVGANRCPWNYGEVGSPCRGHAPNTTEGPEDGIKIELRTDSGTIAEILSPAHYRVTGIARPDDWADMGKLVIVGGLYDAAEFDIKLWASDGTFWLNNDLRIPIDVGQMVEVKEGCLRSWIACKSATKDSITGETDRGAGKGNTINFGGIPFALGQATTTSNYYSNTPIVVPV